MSSPNLDKLDGLNPKLDAELFTDSGVGEEAREFKGLVTPVPGSKMDTVRASIHPSHLVSINP
jgi:hypothetical protein